MDSENSGIGATMLVGPTGGYGGGGFGNGGFGGDWGWIILLLLFAGGGWGNGFGGGMWGMDGLYPWLNNSQNLNSGFRDQMLDSTLTGIQASQNALAQQLYTSQISDLERSFAAQTANTQGLNAVSSQLANCCCENRAATADLKYTLASEACATRANSTANTQLILDKLCQQEIDNLKAQNIALQNQVNMLNLSASQTAQTAALVADNTAQTQYIINRVAPYPIPSYTVTNPNTPAAG